MLARSLPSRDDAQPADSLKALDWLNVNRRSNLTPYPEDNVRGDVSAQKDVDRIALCTFGW